jgi:hypothetical protein
MRGPGSCQSQQEKFPAPRATHLDRVPVLASERILGLLLEALLAFRKALVPIVLSGHVQPSIATLQFEVNFIPELRLLSAEGVTRRGVKKNSLSDSHDCEKSPSRGAVEVERCCRDAVGEGEERFNRIVKWCSKMCAARVC